jgi:hypothetical protein
MGRTYDAIVRAEQQRKRVMRQDAPEDLPNEWKTLQQDRILSRWRRWAARREVETPPEAGQTPLETALVEQIASIEFALGALDDQLSQQLPEMEQRLLAQAREDLNKLEERLSDRISMAADAAAQQLARRHRRTSILLAIALAALAAILLRT